MSLRTYPRSLLRSLFSTHRIKPARPSFGAAVLEQPATAYFFSVQFLAWVLSTPACATFMCHVALRPLPPALSRRSCRVRVEGTCCQTTPPPQSYHLFRLRRCDFLVAECRKRPLPTCHVHVQFLLFTAAPAPPPSRCYRFRLGTSRPSRSDLALFLADCFLPCPHPPMCHDHVLCLIRMASVAHRPVPSLCVRFTTALAVPVSAVSRNCFLFATVVFPPSAPIHQCAMSM